MKAVNFCTIITANCKIAEKAIALFCNPFQHNLCCNESNLSTVLCTIYVFEIFQSLSFEKIQKAYKLHVLRKKKL
jgi:hypothetical protein